VKENEVAMRDMEGRTTNPPTKIRNLQKKLRRKNTERLQSMKYSSRGHWEKPLEKPSKVRLNPHKNPNMPNTRKSGSG